MHDQQTTTLGELAKTVRSKNAGTDRITFDIIFAMTQGGPGNASETLNIYVFQMAFSYQRIGFASALLVLFFILVLMISLVLIRLRRSPW